MSNQMSLKEAERKAFRLSTSQDGLYDTFLGLFIILLSGMTWMDENGLRTPWNVIVVEGIAFAILLGVLAVKKFIVAPRIGRVQYGVERKKRMKRLAIVMGITSLLTVFLFAMTVRAIYFAEPLVDNPPSWSLELDPVHTGAGIFIVAIFSVIAYMNDYPRLYLYGWLFGIGYVVSTYVQDQTGGLFYWPQALAGLTTALIGLVLFLRFLREYAPSTEAAIHEIS
jgi:MFS family permease